MARSTGKASADKGNGAGGKAPVATLPNIFEKVPGLKVQVVNEAGEVIATAPMGQYITQSKGKPGFKSDPALITVEGFALRLSEVYAITK